MAERISQQSRRWLLATVIITVLPHILFQPVWVSVLCATLIGWNLLALRYNKLTPPTLLLLLIGMAGAAGVRHEFTYFFGQDPGVALLIILLGLKQLETRIVRDAYITVLLSLFLQMGLFFYDQSLLTAIMALLGTILALSTLITLQNAPLRPSVSLRLTGKLLLQGLPLMLVMFLVFPRIQGPLWGAPSPGQSRTGLTDSMEPGSISDLIQSSEIVFRVKFSGDLPPRKQQYWRGPVLEQFDGRTWKISGSSLPYSQPAYEPEGRRYDYTTTLEAHEKHWLLALDYPGKHIPNAIYTADYQLLSRLPIRTRTRLELSAFPETHPGTSEADIIRKRNLRLPPDSNPRATALVQQFMAENGAPEAVIKRTLEYMRTQKLVYTLQPPKLGANSVDEFLFNTRRGFCEHFASAFAFMMRRADIPTRVVLGYQGGEINPIDGNLVIRQSDAHAWTEVWLPAQGWVRIDPTSIVAPLRIEEGLAASLSDNESRFFLGWSSLTWLRDLQFQWDALSNSWNQWVLGYDIDQQRRFFERLGMEQPDWKKLTLLLVEGIIILILLLFGWFLLQHRNSDPLDRAWQYFCKKLARHGVPRQAWEGPIDYMKRAGLALPVHQREIHYIASIYAQLRYGNDLPPDASQVRLLAKRIRDIKLP